jgi:diphthine-ammonia ligase
LISSSWQEYEQHFTAALIKLKKQYALSHAVFGDIDLQPTATGKKKFAECRADCPAPAMATGP